MRVGAICPRRREVACSRTSGIPRTKTLGARFGQSLGSAMVYDVEVGGIEALRAGGFLQSE